MNSQLSLTIKAERDELDRITAEVEDLGMQENWSPDLVFRVNLVLEEMVLNVIDYGTEDGVNEIEIILTLTDESLTIEIIDDGSPFDPLSDAPDPDLEATLEERRVGGLGIHLTRSMMDDMRYRREQNKNHLTLVTYKVE